MATDRINNAARELYDALKDIGVSDDDINHFDDILVDLMSEVDDDSDDDSDDE
jgi:hypothetical protein